MQERYMYVVPGHNARLTDLQAAIGVAEVAELEDRNERRRANAHRLDEGLAGIEGVTRPVHRPGRTHVFHQYTVRIGPDAQRDRDTVHKELDAAGIGSGIYYPRALHDYDCYRDHPRVKATTPLPEAERAAREVLSLPVHPWLTDGDLDRIVDTVRSLLVTPGG
jgi:perosamine synthetase